MFITSTFISRLHTQQFHINKPTLNRHSNRHSNRHFYVSEKKFPQELLSPQIIFIFIEGSPVNKSVKYQNRGTMGVQIPFSFPQSLDFKPLQAKARFLPWQMKSTLIIKFSCSEMPCNAEFCVGLSAFHGIVFFLFITTLFAKQRKTEQINTFCSSQIVVSQRGQTTDGGALFNKRV